MLKETIALEVYRQKIEKAEFTAGDRSDYIDHGRPDAKQLKAAQELITKMLSEAAELKKEFHTLVDQSPKEAVLEWVDWHRNVLQAILLETPTNTFGKTRLFTARKTLAEWDKVLAREQDYVSINWYYLKDYKAKAEKEFKNSWWKIW